MFQLRKSPSPSIESPKKGVLKKSKSLDLDQTGDLRKQLEALQTETSQLKEKVAQVERDNHRLAAENSKLPAIHTDPDTLHG